MVKKMVVGVLLILFLYSRFIGLSWGLPYPMHPDERNMAAAVQGLTCEWGAPLQECFNPRFFAYGQLPLYLAYGGIVFSHFLLGANQTVSFAEATISLRTISVMASLLNAYVLYRLILLLITPKDKTRHNKTNPVYEYAALIGASLFAFSPYAVQFSHFGTTESILMLLYTGILYYTLVMSDKHFHTKTPLVLGVLLGIGIAVKVSSVIFLALPFLVIVWSVLPHRKQWVQGGIALGKVVVTAFCTATLLSPQTLISWGEFMRSFAYESSVATGAYRAFYTRQFTDTVPVLFQLEKIFPYALGWGTFLLSALGFFLLPWKNRHINIIRLAILTYLLPTSFLFTKWTRFMAPVFPLMSLFAFLFLSRLYQKTKNIPVRAAVVTAFLACLLPGIAYLSVYTQPDVRFRASEWIYSNIPADSKILSETANVIDIPIPPPLYQSAPPAYQYMSFDFYNLDADPALQTQLKRLTDTADYIFVPSRRVFMNLSNASFPETKQYYDELFSGRLGYIKIREFTSYPNILLFGKTLFEFPDEGAEETWSVFDHPVIRIYQKKTGTVDLSGYEIIVREIAGKTYRLLVADSPQKWEQGLMRVRTKEDIGGNDGMIFLFPEKEIKTFWNKNTVSELDIYWMDGEKMIDQDMLPSIEKSKQIVTVSSPMPADTVVEIIR